MDGSAHVCAAYRTQCNHECIEVNVMSVGQVIRRPCFAKFVRIHQ